MDRDVRGALGNPHDDIRFLAFLNSTTLLATCDGGIYGLPDPQNVPQGLLGNPFGNGDAWVDLNVNIQDTEFFQVAYDSIDGLVAWRRSRQWYVPSGKSELTNL